MSTYLTNDQIFRLTDAVVSAGMDNEATRDILLQGINRGYVAALPLKDNMLDQTLSDLARMNRVPYLLGNEVPLKIWLSNAVHRSRATFLPEQALFQQTLDEVSSKSQDVIGQATGVAPVPEAGTLERIIHEDDLLAYGWLQGALAVGASVARLMVPRYESGHLKLKPGTDQPVTYGGTGWLIGKQHIITNHHVINARSESEPLASEPDLAKQAAETVVEFDYDAQEATGTPAEVESLVAWVHWNATPVLDYAILKLRQPSERTPLALAPRATVAAGSGILPVNIIQHPRGHPKTLGIRNNLVSSLGEWELRYFTDTDHGSSGSPVCNDNWQVIALHRAQDFLDKNLNFQGKSTAYINRGVRIDRIVADLQTNHPALWLAIEATVV